MKVLVGICTSFTTMGRRKVVRETWTQRAHNGVTTIFFRGGEVEQETSDGVILPVKDDYDHLPAKVMAFFRWALRNRDFDYLFKCDDDTYIVTERLCELLAQGGDFIGDHTLQRQSFAQGGAGYAISRPLLQRLVAMEIPAKGMEDLEISRAVLQISNNWRSTHLLSARPSNPPSPFNEQVSAHRIDPEAMLRIHRTFEAAILPYGILARFRAVHRRWVGELSLRKDGAFIGGPVNPDGRWQLQDGNLVLRWHHWETDFLRSTDSGFEGKALRLYPIQTDPKAFPKGAGAYGCRRTITFDNLELNSNGRGRLGLGNQLFRIAATIGIGHRLDLEPVISDWDWGPSRLPYHFQLEGIRSFQLAKNSNDTVRLAGFLQDYRHFHYHSEAVRRLFLPNSAAIAQARRILGPDAAHGCSVHVRRGDYLRSDGYIRLGKEYYQRAIRWMKERGVKRFFVFSNDPNWCRHIFRPLSNCTVVEKEDEVVTLAAMKMLPHHITANSTFSWWGAYLSWLEFNVTGSIILPKEWFAGPLQGMNVEGYRVPGWNIL